ncbi:MAG: transglycosylase SLT domain-containing protein [Xanthomonadales bacterium]|nr:transglycosylase SLT domain-containing protein [Xanthomonadales bacterium]
MTVRPAAFLFAVLLVVAPPLAADAARDRTPAWRAEFLAAAVSLAAGRQDDYAQRRRHLDGYVLAPYLDYAALRRELRTLDARRARAFLASEGDSQLGRQFLRDWLGELARRGDWAGFQADDPGDELGGSLACHRLRAGIERGGDAAALRAGLRALWPTGQGLPDACDPVIAHGRAQGWLDAAATWQRLRLAVEAGNGGLAGFLARQLPANQRAAGERLARAAGDPEATLRAAAAWPDEPATREAATLALQRRARSAVESAIGHWQALSPRLAFSDAQRAAVLREIAVFAAAGYRADAGDWLDRVPASARDAQIADWRLRTALAALDWPAVLALVNGLPADQAQAPRMRYWRARALDETGQAEAARNAFAALAGDASFHGFLAADRAGLPYSLCPIEVGADPQRQRALLADIDLARALELHAVGWRPEAARALQRALSRGDAAGRDQMLLMVAAQGWHDRVIHALSGGDDLRKYALRFPLPRRDTVEREAAANGLDPAWVLALIRAESAWQPDARSPADAWGLMQLLPGTGRQVAAQLGEPWQGTATLLDPDRNIRLGSRYLADQAARFGGSPWLASAAYNAGPAPVQRWLDQRGDLPADVFIETIPYRETREYVARVLAFSVIYDWRLHGRTRPLASRLPDPGQRPAATAFAASGGVHCAAPLAQVPARDGIGMEDTAP